MALDGYERFYAEKIWEMIPAVYRHEDGLAEPADVLRAFVEIIGREAANTRRSIDRLWDDQAIELSSDWAVPYIGDLVATRMVSALNSRARRVDVAKTVYYRRRKGTPRVLEELALDMTGWEGKLVEGFARLARARHRLDPGENDPGFDVGRFTATPPGGFADLRSPRSGEIRNGPFDEFAHTPDVRGAPAGASSALSALAGVPVTQRQRGGMPAANIRKFGLHLYRLRTYAAEGVRPAPAGQPTALRFDPSGRDIPLFMTAGRNRGAPEIGTGSTGFEEWHAADEWDLPGPMRCRVLGHEVFVFTEQGIAALSPVFSAGHRQQLRSLVGLELRGVYQLRIALGKLPSSAFFLGVDRLRDMRAHMLVDNCGKAELTAATAGAVALMPAPPVVLERQHLAAGSLLQWRAPPAGRNVAFDPERGRMRWQAAPASTLRVDYHYGFAGNVGAGPYPRPEAATRQPDVGVNGGGNLPALIGLGTLQIDDSDTYSVPPVGVSVDNAVWQAAEGARPYVRLFDQWNLSAAANNAELVLDGWWLGAGQPRSIVLDGNWRSVRFVSCTIDPGGRRTANPADGKVPPINLVVRGEVDSLEIDHSIVGPIDATSGVINRLTVRDSIVQSEAMAVRQAGGESVFVRSTLIGAVEIQKLYASETLFDGLVTATDTQSGCFRFSARRPGSRVPKPYRAHFVQDSARTFVSVRYGDASYTQLNDAAPRELHRGAENGSEIGVWSELLNPIKLDALITKVNEYAPFGLVPFYINET